jgi:hypothetical protein
MITGRAFRSDNPPEAGLYEVNDLGILAISYWDGTVWSYVGYIRQQGFERAKQTALEYYQNGTFRSHPFNWRVCEQFTVLIYIDSMTEVCDG